MQKRRLSLICILLIGVLMITGCGAEKNQEGTYEQIAMSQAKELLETEEGYILLDVRRVDEYESGHIPGAMLLPNEDIPVDLKDYEATEDKSGYFLEFETIADKDQRIYIYCRSGNRSKQASEKLVHLGYTNVVEIGGIQSWTGEIEYE